MMYLGKSKSRQAYLVCILNYMLDTVWQSILLISLAAHLSKYVEKYLFIYLTR